MRAHPIPQKSRGEVHRYLVTIQPDQCHLTKPVPIFNLANFRLKPPTYASPLSGELRIDLGQAPSRKTCLSVEARFDAVTVVHFTHPDVKRASTTTTTQGRAGNNQPEAPDDPIKYLM